MAMKISLHPNESAKRQAGQALAELAVFGSIFLLILAALLSYGLRYNFQQRAQMLAFRRALKIASDEDRGSGAYTLVEDRHIPDPMGLFGVGSTTPITASASVTRDYMMHAQPIDVESLEGGVMDIQTRRDDNGTQWMRRIYKSAGFRIEHNVPEETLDKYSLIYGSTKNLGGGNLRIIDRCSGEIIAYETCYMQARMLVDASFCTDKCNEKKIPGSEMNCSATCNKLTNAPNQSSNGYSSANGGAWYAANYSYTNCTLPNGNPDRCYTFPILDQLFVFAGPGGKDESVMGVQPVGAMNAVRDESIHKTETLNDITTTESAVWTDTLNRTLVHQDNLGSDGYEQTHSTPSGFVNVQVDNIQSVVTGSTNKTYETDK